MTMTVEENYAAGTSPDDFIAPDVPPDDEGGDVSAGQDPEIEAPYGWMRDPETGDLRPKKRPGRPKNPPGPEELAAKEPVVTARDRAPGPRPRTRPPEADDAAYPAMPRGGVIALGVNRLYRRAGKIVRAMDYDIGTAIIECTRKEDDDDITVGEAWENLCKANPRIRAFILRVIAGGAWGELVMAHAPIFLAIAMKPAIMRLIPFKRLVESMAERDEDAPEGDLGGLTAEDAGQVADMADMAARMAAARFGDVPPDVVAEAQRMASKMMGGEVPVPAAFRRQQPKNSSRAQRSGKR